MLQALELVGFKSFADRTRFEFPPGITVIVGPNGSGKSNVVDAVRWVLGEQSAKSLRGREMADVIFNGSATRRPLATAEVTLTFDNRSGGLPRETREVQVTRRVYRSGEGEYLINRQAARLRDVREMFAGTGAATEAYSIIEQGKVDVLLTSSARDRRVIFEEAAGISRFKAKKIEAERRLERVEQNLLRLKDVVDEVESRLRGVRTQAGKARRYREHSDRLRGLRIALAKVDARELAARSGDLQQKLSQARAAAEAAGGEAQQRQRELDAADQQLTVQADEVQRIEVAQAQCSERLAHQAEALRRQRQRAGELQAEGAAQAVQVQELNERIAQLGRQAAEVEQAVALAQEERDAQDRLVERSQTEHHALLEQTEAARAEVETRRAAYVHAMRAAAALANEITGLDAELGSSAAQRQRLEQRTAGLAAALESATAAAQRAAEQRQTAHEAAQRVADDLSQAQSLLAELRRQSAQLTREQGRLRQRHAAATERAALLEELERRLEGVESGAKELLLRAREAGADALTHVHGLLADLLHVRLETAAAIEQALGESAHALVVDSVAKVVERYQHGGQLSGRVSVIGREGSAPEGDERLRGQPGIVARADELVETTEPYRGLAQRLLAGTWIVETLNDALRLAGGPGGGALLVTLAGECVWPSGRVTFGPRPAVAGPLSRRSELRALGQQIAELDERLAETERLAGRVEQSLLQAESRERELKANERQSSELIAERRSQASLAESQLQQTSDQLASVAEELRWLAAKESGAAQRRQKLLARQSEIEGSLVDLDSAIREAVVALEALQRGGGDRLAAITSAKVDLARREERLDSLHAQQANLAREGVERRSALSAAERLVLQTEERAAQLSEEIARSEQERERLEAQRSTLAEQAEQLARARESARAARGRLAAGVQAAQEQLDVARREAHQLELSEQALRHQSETLAERLREDYGLELDVLESEPTEPIADRAAAEAEIAELRRKLQLLGHVNLDALEEIDALEERFNRLSAQYDDLSQARTTLTALIRRINEDSRRLFAATLEAVRGHFQELFRKLFGGGQADIVVEADVDLLDSGVEIVARPPGKELRSISLLSGGEKTLTCVALLLAIFRSRPSPFCILDEVDAALDEANIERFIAVLQEFAGTQFIVVTHSKKTMTCAQTLYGVTMQESGVSKRVAVRFEDVREDGQIVGGDEQEAA